MPVLTIEAQLTTPIAVGAGNLHLDALLTAAHPDSTALNRASPIPPRVSLPLAHVRAAGMSVYAASSWIIPDGAQVRTERLTRRIDSEDVDAAARGSNLRIQRAAARYSPVLVIDVPSVTWLAVGSRSGIRKLLRFVTSIGAMRGHGYGRIKKWNVRYADVSAIACIHDGARAMRFLPVAWMANHTATEHGPVAPPYWHAARATSRVRPSMLCELRPDVKRRVESLT